MNTVELVWDAVLAIALAFTALAGYFWLKSFGLLTAGFFGFFAVAFGWLVIHEIRKRRRARP